MTTMEFPKCQIPWSDNVCIFILETSYFQYQEQTLFMLKQVKNILPTASLKTLYHSMIQPHFTYG